MQRDELFEALYECWLRRTFTPGCSQALPSTQRGRINRAVRELRAIDATPDQIRVRWQMLVDRWPRVTITPQTLCAHWATCDTPTETRSAIEKWRASR